MDRFDSQWLIADVGNVRREAAQDLHGTLQSLVGGEDHRPLAAVSIVDEVEEYVGGVATVGKVADLIDHEERRMCVGGQDRGHVFIAESG